MADETDAELDHELERELEAEDLVTGGLPELGPGGGRAPGRGAGPVVASRAAPVRLPDLVIVDGGKGQLSSACAELQRLGLHELAIIGLAKEFEEIYRPGRPLPLRLPEDSGRIAFVATDPR